MLFVVVFYRAKLIIAPFLPKSSLLFITKTVSTLPSVPLRIGVLTLILFVSTILNSSYGCVVKRFFKHGLFGGPSSHVFERDRLRGARRFCGGCKKGAVVVTHFMPVIHAFTPFITNVNGVRCCCFVICGLVKKTL